MRRSGLVLILAGVLAIVFFVLTDPRVLGPSAATLRWSDNPIDAAYDATAGTLLGLAGSALVVLVGLGLVSRRQL